MSSIDAYNAIGYLASAATLVTFAQNRMFPMRLSAIAANILFITYGLLGAIYPVFLLHVALLPVNLMRLYQQRGATPVSLVEEWQLRQSC